MAFFLDLSFCLGRDLADTCLARPPFPALASSGAKRARKPTTIFKNVPGRSRIRRFAPGRAMPVSALPKSTLPICQRAKRRCCAGSRRWRLHNFGRRRSLLLHLEGHVARKRAGGRPYVDFSRGSASRHGDEDFGIRKDGERSPNVTEGNGMRTGQTGPQNRDGCSHRTGGRPCFHKSSQSYGQAEDRAVFARPATVRCSVERTVGVLHEPAVGGEAVATGNLGAEAV